MSYRSTRFVAGVLVAMMAVSSCADAKSSTAGESSAQAAASESSESKTPDEASEPEPEVVRELVAQITVTGSPDGFAVAPLAGAEVVPDETHGALVTVSSTGEAGAGNEEREMPVGLRVEIVAPPGAEAKIMSDRSVAILDDQGVLIGGLAAPEGTTASGGRWRGAWSLDSTDGSGIILAYQGTAVQAALPVAISMVVGSGLVSSLSWGNREGGESLGVVPTAWGRVSGLAGREYGFTEVTKAMPETDTNVMLNQFHCHFDGALDKKQWNLEPWRPDIGYLGYIMAKCNPT